MNKDMLTFPTLLIDWMSLDMTPSCYCTMYNLIQYAHPT